jgi:hypothetical protein
MNKITDISLSNTHYTCSNVGVQENTVWTLQLAYTVIDGGAQDLFAASVPATAQHHTAWRDLPGHRHGKLFIGKPRKKRADDLLKLSRHLLRLTVATFMGHAPVRGHLYTMGLFDGDPTCRFCMKETETVQHIICYCEALAR